MSEQKPSMSDSAEVVVRKWDLRNTLGLTGGQIFAEHNALARAHLALTAKLAEAEDNAAGFEKAYMQTMRRAEAAEARAKELVKYARHIDPCMGDYSGMVTGVCTCGLSAALGAP